MYVCVWGGGGRFFLATRLSRTRSRSDLRPRRSSAGVLHKRMLTIRAIARHSLMVTQVSNGGAAP